MGKHPDIGSHSGATAQQRNELIRLLDISRKNGPVTYIEIGVLYGGNFIKILKTLENDDFAYGFDLFEDFEKYKDPQTHGGNVINKSDLEEFIDREERLIGKYKLIKGDSGQTIQQLPTLERAVVLIDGNHTFEAVKKDFTELNKKIKYGFIMFHDIGLDCHVGRNSGKWGVDKFLASRFVEKNNWIRMNTRISGVITFKK